MFALCFHYFACTIVVCSLCHQRILWLRFDPAVDPAVLGDHDGEVAGHLKGHIGGHRMPKNHLIETTFHIRHFLLFRLLRRAIDTASPTVESSGCRTPLRRISWPWRLKMGSSCCWGWYCCLLETSDRCGKTVLSVFSCFAQIAFHVQTTKEGKWASRGQWRQTGAHSRDLSFWACGGELWVAGVRFWAPEVERFAFEVYQLVYFTVAPPAPFGYTRIRASLPNWTWPRNQGTASDRLNLGLN